MIRKFVAAALMSAAVVIVCARANAACQVGKIAELPITMRGFQPLVPAAVNGHDVLFLVDSGAFFSTISPSAAAEMKLTLAPAPWGMTIDGVGGAAARLNLTTVKTLTLVGVPISNVEFLVTSSGGGDLAGLIGQNILGLGDVEYDLTGGAIRLLEPKGGCGGVSLAYWAANKPYSVIDIDRPVARVAHTIGEAFINGTRVRVVFDTGASTSVLTLRGARRAGVSPTSPGTVPLGATHGVGSRMITTWWAPISSFKLGDEEIKNTNLTIGDIELNDADMLLGADFFLSHRVYVANSQHKLYFTYNGGQVFSLAAKADRPIPTGVSASAAATPADATKTADDVLDADGFSRRGAALASHHDYAAAIADFTAAIGLAPNEPKYFYERATAHLSAHQLFLAMGDLDQTLKLAPGDVQALAVRANLRLIGQDKTGAAADLDEASQLAPKEADIRLRLAAMYSRMGQLERAIAEDDLWITTHTGDGEMGEALNNRCWSRALEGRDLDKALEDCNRAVRLTSQNGSVLDSRALVYLRRGEFDRAISDYNAALAQKPKGAWSFYGRGLAKLAKGMTVDGQADLAAARALAPGLPDEAKLHGIAPPAS